MGNPETDWPDEYEIHFCPICPGVMVRTALPVRNYGTNDQEIIAGYFMIQAIKQLEPPPDDIEWIEMLMCIECNLAFEPDEYDNAQDIY